MYPKLVVRLLLAVFAVSTGATFTLDPVFASEKTKQLFIESPDRSDRKISKDEILKIMEDIKTATESKNVQGIVQYLAPFVTSEVILHSPKGTQKFSINRIGEHDLYFQQGFNSVQKIDYLYYEVEIRVSPDGKTAFAADTSIVDITPASGGPRLLESSTSMTRFALVEGQLRIISNNSISKIDVPPGLNAGI